jgi:hypothetical protein
LRDAKSSLDDPFFQLRLLRDDYARKPAFAVLQHLIRELG